MQSVPELSSSKVARTFSEILIQPLMQESLHMHPTTSSMFQRSRLSKSDLPTRPLVVESSTWELALSHMFFLLRLRNTFCVDSAIGLAQALFILWCHFIASAPSESFGKVVSRLNVGNIWQRDSTRLVDVDASIW